jgi:NAD-dependent SIR2 family protein deacetylase
MKLHPFDEVVKNAAGRISEGWTVYQQFNCAHCRKKQTMSDMNKFHKTGRCEECGEITDILKNGCNFMAVISRGKGFTAARPK